jgi:hypothetical protein
VRTPGRRDAITALAVALAVAAAHLLYGRQSGDLTIQAQLNQRFAERTIAAAFEKYPRLRPPLYPMALWAARRVGLEPPAFQLLVLDAMLVGLALYGRRFFRRVHPAFAVIALAVAHFVHVNLYQTTAETLFAPLLAAFALLLWRYAVSARGVAWLGVATSLLCLTRYFGLYLATPLALVHVLAARGRPASRRLRDAAAIAVLALAPIGYWMWITHEQTGLWTGADRTAPRELPDAVRHWEQLTGLDDHLLLTAKTLLVDFFSPRAYAALSVVTLPYQPSSVEWGMLAITIGAVTSGLLAWRRTGWGVSSSPALFVAEVAAAYFALTLALWTVGNNDPIHTRFLFPAYPLLLIATFHAYDAMIERGASWLERAPWIALLAGFVAIQAARSWRAEPLPVRYLW